MRIFTLLLLTTFYTKAQLPTLYFISGIGSDERVFDSLKFNKNYKKVFLKYSTPTAGDNMKSFSEGFYSQIDTSKAMVFIGSSLGGMLSAELNARFKNSKAILISAAQNRQQLPWRYRTRLARPIFNVIPGFVFKNVALRFPIKVNKRSAFDYKFFRNMLRSKSPQYYKRTARLILNWDKKSISNTVFQIHGEKDHLLPFKNFKNTFASIKKGSHLITLTHQRELSLLINNILENESPTEIKIKNLNVSVQDKSEK